jgi:hypothetical protein
MTYFLGFILPKKGEKIEVYQNNFTWKIGMAFPGIMSIIQVLLMMTVFTLDSPSYYCGKDEEKVFKITYYNSLKPLFLRYICKTWMPKMHTRKW